MSLRSWGRGEFVPAPPLPQLRREELAGCSPTQCHPCSDWDPVGASSGPAHAVAAFWVRVGLARRCAVQRVLSPLQDGCASPKARAPGAGGDGWEAEGGMDV